MAATTLTMPVYMRIGDGMDHHVGDVTFDITETSPDVLALDAKIMSANMVTALRAIADHLETATAEPDAPR